MTGCLKWDRNGAQEDSTWTRKPSREVHEQLKTRWGLTCALPSGFSITELQRKQAMLNASKQQATGKPKGKRGESYSLGSSSLDCVSLSKAMAASRPHPWRCPLATLYRCLFSRVVREMRDDSVCLTSLTSRRHQELELTSQGC